jgi:hypothetical protein
MTDLSPAAQAVLDAADSTFNQAGTTRQGIAAALQAAVDKVLPEVVNAVGDEHDDARQDQWTRIRRKLLAIAAELEGGND